ncbi:hypothetical protein AAG570_008065 [Ranatra chinensis]|uniref:Mitochondrial brown fat uncoupling protein 1 n=1 Tax=Ranatra chinensis TaxID=642074 RepID=A0ABD0XTN3_9HEMI
MVADNLPLQYKILSAGTAACFADFVTFPFDTAKVRLQIQGESNGILALARNGALVGSGPAHYSGLVGTIRTIVRNEGTRSLFNGLSAGLQRQLCFSSIRIGLYDSVKGLYQQILYGETNRVSVPSRIAAGLTTGGLAVFLAQPTDVVKVRFQAQLKGDPRNRYNSTMEAYRMIAKQEGTAGLWKGTVTNAGRNAIVNVSEIVCYDIIKDTILSYGLMRDAIPCHFISAVIAGFCTTVVASPIDVIKTRYMNSSSGTYSSAINCAVRTFSEEGCTAFFKGFTPSFCRLVSWNIVMWISYEQVKSTMQKTITV